MNVTPLQLVLQLGIAGLIVWVGYRIAMRALDRWAKSEQDRTSAIADGFRAITNSVNTHSAADIASHNRLAESHGEVREAIASMQGQLEGMTLREGTGPVRRVAIPRVVNKANNGDER
jgi:hypothetical protein